MVKATRSLTRSTEIRRMRAPKDDLLQGFPSSLGGRSLLPKAIWTILFLSALQLLGCGGGDPAPPPESPARCR